MTKAELRKIYLAKQKKLSPNERAIFSESIADIFFANFDLSAVNYLHCFISIEKFNEVDTGSIFRRIWFQFPKIKTLVPRLNAETGLMESILYGKRTELILNDWGIAEPPAGEVLSEQIVDLAIVPGTCFDMQCHRVGYGKGFYDRFLSGCRTDCLKVGLSYFPPVRSISDINPFDVRLDRCVTPDVVFDRDAL